MPRATESVVGPACAIRNANVCAIAGVRACVVCETYISHNSKSSPAAVLGCARFPEGVPLRALLRRLRGCARPCAAAGKAGCRHRRSVSFVLRCSAGASGCRNAKACSLFLGRTFTRVAARVGIPTSRPLPGPVLAFEPSHHRVRCLRLAAAIACAAWQAAPPAKAVSLRRLQCRSAARMMMASLALHQFDPFLRPGWY